MSLQLLLIGLYGNSSWYDFQRRVLPTAKIRPALTTFFIRSEVTLQCRPAGGKNGLPSNMTEFFESSVAPCESVARRRSMRPDGIGSLANFCATDRSTISPAGVSIQM